MKNVHEISYMNIKEAYKLGWITYDEAMERMAYLKTDEACSEKTVNVESDDIETQAKMFFKVDTFFKLLLLVVMFALFMLTSACSPKKETSGSQEFLVSPDMSLVSKCTDVTPADDSRKDVLVIGDSISLGYTPDLAVNLSNNFQVIHSPCNAMNSRWGVRYVEEYLAVRDHFEVVTFNYGIWDSAYSNEMNVDEYKANLKYIAEKIKTKTNRAVFIGTTYTSPTAGPRMEEFRRASFEVMQELNIQVIDLYEFGYINHLLAPDTFHYNEIGNKVLADYISRKLNL